MSEFRLIEEEDNYLITKPSYTRNRPGLYPSEASVKYTINGLTFVEGKCLRAAWYRSRGAVANPTPVGLAMKGTLGKKAEEGIIERWKQMGIWVDNNVKFFNSKYVLSGELDAIIKNPVTNGLIGSEIKSYYGHYANQQITGSKRPIKGGEPKIEHLLQALLYQWEYRDILEEYRIYYIERGDGHRVEFRIGSDEDTGKSFYQPIDSKYWNYFDGSKKYMPFTIHDIHKRLEELISYIRESRIPPKDYGTPYTEEEIEYLHSIGKISKTKYEAWQKNPAKNPIEHWACSYCNYASQCKQDELALVINEK